VLHDKVGKKRPHFRPRGHGMSFRRTEWPPGGGGAGGCRSCGFWQPARVQYNDPAVNRRWWTRPHNGPAGPPDKSHCPAVALMTHALPAAAARQRSLQPNQTARREPPQCSAGIGLLKTPPASAQQRDPHPPRDRRLHARSSLMPRLVRALGVRWPVRIVGRGAGDDRHGLRRRRSRRRPGPRSTSRSMPRVRLLAHAE
jgi:hypothetical protein